MKDKRSMVSQSARAGWTTEELPQSGRYRIKVAVSVSVNVRVRWERRVKWLGRMRLGVRIRVSKARRDYLVSYDY